MSAASAALAPLALALLAAAPAQDPAPPDDEPPPAETPETPGATPPRGAGTEEPDEPDDPKETEEPIVIELLAPEPARARAAEAGPGVPPLDLAVPRTPEEVEQALAALARAHPGLLRVESLGRSGAGRPLPLAVIGAGAGAPALLVGDHDEGGGPRRRDLGLGLVEALLRRAEDDAELRDLLARTTVYVVPVLAADERARSLAGADAPAEAVAGPARFDRSFPAGWRPEGIRPGSGPYPLAVAEARALHGFLLEHPAVAMAVGLSAGTEAEAAGQPAQAGGPAAEAPPLLARVWSRAAPGVPAAVPAGEPRGGWLDTCRAELGIDVLAAVPGTAAPEGLVAGVAALLACLPALEFGAPAVSPLTPGMWQVDVALGNPGRLATGAAQGGARPRFAAGDVGVELSGGQLVAAAYRAPEDGGFRVVGPAAGGRVGLGELRGGEAGVLRLVLEAPAGAELTLLGRAPRAGTATLSIPLP